MSTLLQILLGMSVGFIVLSSTIAIYLYAAFRRLELMTVLAAAAVVPSVLVAAMCYRRLRNGARFPAPAAPEVVTISDGIEVVDIA